MDEDNPNPNIVQQPTTSEPPLATEAKVEEKSQKKANNVLIYFLSLIILILVFVLYLFYQKIKQIKPSFQIQNLITEEKVTSSPSPSPSKSNFEYTYFTQEEVRQKLTTLLINANKNNKDYKIEEATPTINLAVNEYLALDTFTKWVYSTCPSTFSANGGYSPIDTLGLPFTIPSTYKIICIGGTALSPASASFVMNTISSGKDLGISNYFTGGSVYVLGFKAGAGDMYGVSAPDVMSRINNLQIINGVRFEVKSEPVLSNETGTILSYDTFFYAYKLSADYLVTDFIILSEKTNENYKKLDLTQYPNIDSNYKKVIDTLTEFVNLIQPK